MKVRKKRKDEYAWLRVDNWSEVLKDPEKLGTRARGHLEKENKHTEEVLKAHAQLREKLCQELRAGIEEESVGAPDQDGDYAYYTRHKKGCQYPIYCRRSVALPSKETALLNVNDEAAPFTYYHVGARRHSPDHRFFAWSADINGSESYSLNIREIENGKTMRTVVAGMAGNFVWGNDSEHIIYIYLDKHLRPCEARLHKVGQKQEMDSVLYRENNPGFFLGLTRASSRRFIVINAHDHETSEVHLLDADYPGKKPPQMVKARQKGVEYEVEEQGGQLVIRTNAGGKKDYRLMTANSDSATNSKWKPLYTPEKNTLLEDFMAFKEFIVCLERKDAKQRMLILSANEKREIPLAAALKNSSYDLELVSTSAFDSDFFRFSYSSLAIPKRVYDYRLGTRRKILRKRQKVPSGHDPADYRCLRLAAKSHDGEEIPVSMVYHRETRPGKDTPLLLYGYGAYGITMPAAFSSYRLPLLKRGFIYAIAHIRGGKEKGSAWYESGKREKKQNTFSDFIAVAEYLISAGYTSENSLAILGGSAGGMLIGAVLNQRPELFAAALLRVPFVDVLNTMSDKDLPLTPPEWLEWGNPIKSKNDFAVIFAYCPYQNIERKTYPSILVSSGLCDPRVGYWEAAKWVARLRAKKIDNNPLLLWTEMSSGHAGASGRFSYLKEIARDWVFLLSSLKIENRPLFAAAKKVAK